MFFKIWEYFATNILRQPAYMIGLIVMIGYILLGKKWYDVLAGVIKAVVGYLILAVGSGGLVSNFRPVLVGLRDRFNIDAIHKEALRILKRKKDVVKKADLFKTINENLKDLR